MSSWNGIQTVIVDSKMSVKWSQNYLPGDIMRAGGSGFGNNSSKKEDTLRGAVRTEFEPHSKNKYWDPVPNEPRIRNSSIAQQQQSASHSPECVNLPSFSANLIYFERSIATIAAASDAELPVYLSSSHKTCHWAIRQTGEKEGDYESESIERTNAAEA